MRICISNTIDVSIRTIGFVIGSMSYAEARVDSVQKCFESEIQSAVSRWELRQSEVPKV